VCHGRGEEPITPGRMVVAVRLPYTHLKTAIVQGFYSRVPKSVALKVRYHSSPNGLCGGTKLLNSLVVRAGQQSPPCANPRSAREERSHDVRTSDVTVQPGYISFLLWWNDQAQRTAAAEAGDPEKQVMRPSSAATPDWALNRLLPLLAPYACQYWMIPPKSMAM
jgi:hypothetical protein